MDNHHVLNDPLAGMGGMTAGQREQYRQMGQQPQHSQQLHQQPFNDFALDPSLIGDSWQQNPGQSYGHAGHQDVFSPPPQHQQPVYGQYGHSPQPQQFSYAQPQQQPQQQPIYPTQYASIYGQQSHSPAPQNAVHYDNNQFNGMPNNAQSIMNGDQNQSRGFQSFDRPAAAFPYPSANVNRGPTPQQSITPQQLDRDVQYLGQSRNTSTPQQQSNGDVNNLFDQNWGSQPQLQYQQSTPVPQRSQPQQVLAPNPQPANHVAAPSRPPTATSTSLPQSQPSLKRSSPTPSQQASSTQRKKKSDDLGLKITHAEQLANAPPERRFEDAPFLFIEEEMIWLPDKLADKALPKWHVKSNRSGRTLVEGLHERLASTGRAHKKLSSAKKYQSSGLTKTERLKTTSATGSASNSPRPSVSSETESSEYTSDEEDSDYSSDDDEIMDLRTLEEVRPEPRPADIAEAAAWDAFTIMYSPAGRRPHPEERRTVGEKFPQLIGKLREDLIKANTDLATAEAAKAPNVKDLKVEQKLREQALVKALRVAIDSPHQDLRDTLFSFDRFVAMVGNILRMVLKSKNSTGDIAMAVLELMSTYKFKGPSKEALEKIKWPQVAKAIRKTLDNKATDSVIAKKQEDAARFLQAIQDGQVELKQPTRVGSFTAPKAAPKADDSAETKSDSIPSHPATAPSTYQGTAGLKRAREPDSSNSIPNKRTTPITSEPPKTGPKAVITLGAPVKSAASSSFFSKLGKPAPKPAAPPAAAAPKPIVKKAAPPQAPKPSILGSLLDSINAPKSEPKKVEAIKRAPETPEEKRKRERKESRRHLRVKFKEDGELEEIRLFSHDKAEDEGRDVDMLRDAHDDRSEGMMLKHNRIDADAVDEDDDTTMVEAPEADINDKEYPQLIEIDFSDLSDEKRKKNVVTRGGYAEITSPQSKIQVNREAAELMVVYTDESDIPDSAKEPSTLQAENKEPARFADVKNQVIKDRLRDIQFSGEEVAWSNMMNKLDSDLIAKAQLKQGPESIKLIIDTINSNPNVDVRNFYVPPGMDKDAMANLYKVFASKQGLPFPATQAPLWMSQGMQQSWYEGLVSEEKRKKDEAAEKERLAVEEEARKVFEARQQLSFAPPMGAPNMGQPPMGQPPFMGAPPMGGHYQGMPGGPPPDPAQFAALMASMGLPNPSAPPAMPQWGQPPSMVNPFPPPQAQNYNNDNGNPNPYPSNNSYGQDNNQYGGYNNDAYGNNRPRGGNTYGDESSDGNYGGNFNQNHNRNQGQGQGKKKKWGKNKKRADPDAPPPLEQYGAGESGHGRQGRHDGAYKRKTIPCQFFQKGQCSKGDECTFIHEMEY